MNFNSEKSFRKQHQSDCALLVLSRLIIILIMAIFVKARYSVGRLSKCKSYLRFRLNRFCFVIQSIEAQRFAFENYSKVFITIWTAKSNVMVQQIQVITYRQTKMAKSSRGPIFMMDQNEGPKDQILIE